MSRTLVRDMAIYLPAQVVPAVVAFFSIPILTHFFPPADYGDYVLVLGAVAVLTTITGLFATAESMRWPPSTKHSASLSKPSMS